MLTLFKIYTLQGSVQNYIGGGGGGGGGGGWPIENCQCQTF